MKKLFPYILISTFILCSCRESAKETFNRQTETLKINQEWRQNMGELVSKTLIDNINNIENKNRIKKAGNISATEILELDNTLLLAKKDLLDFRLGKYIKNIDTKNPDYYKKLYELNKEDSIILIKQDSLMKYF